MMASGVEKALRDVRKSSTSGQLKGAGSLQRGHAGARAQEKICVPFGQGQDLMVTIQQGLRSEGLKCRW